MRHFLRSSQAKETSISQIILVSRYAKNKRPPQRKPFCFRARTLGYFTLNRMIAKVKSASDSINARPRTRNRNTAGRAPGLRATASQEEATARPWPRPQRPEAMAMEIPAAIATMLAWEESPPLDCANAGTAMQRTESVIKAFCIVVRMCDSNASLRSPCSGWLTLTVLAPSRCRGVAAGAEAIPAKLFDETPCHPKRRTRITSAKGRFLDFAALRSE